MGSSSLPRSVIWLFRRASTPSTTSEIAATRNTTKQTTLGQYPSMNGRSAITGVMSDPRQRDDVRQGPHLAVASPVP